MESALALTEHTFTAPIHILGGHSLLQVGIAGGAVGLAIWAVGKLARKGLEDLGVLKER